MKNEVKNLESSLCETPISFHGQMVRSILSGDKNQTRRVVKDEAIYDLLISHDCNYQTDIEYLKGLCPFGKPGDFLWVKETWRGPYVTDEEELMLQSNTKEVNFDDYETRKRCAYEADGSMPDFLGSDYIVKKWNPRIHMPRWASRILLQITDIRIEHLHSISENDLIKEGIKEDQTNKLCKFIDLWERTGGTWIENPWVWVITFSRIICHGHPTP